MALSVRIGDRLVDAAAEWAETRMQETEEALEQKLEQALLEVEQLFLVLATPAQSGPKLRDRVRPHRRQRRRLSRRG
jgi:hypothetical protein